MLVKKFSIKLIALISLTSIKLFPAILIHGDIKKEDKSFSFEIGPHASTKYGFPRQPKSFFVGAKEAIPDNEFAIAVQRIYETKFTPMAPKKVKLNGKEDQDNPINGKAIKLMTLATTPENLSPIAEHYSGKPVIVTENEDGTIYEITNYSFDPEIGYIEPHLEIISSPEINAADGNPGTIIGIEKAGSYIFTAVKSNTEDWGEFSSGIGVGITGKDGIKLINTESMLKKEKGNSQKIDSKKVKAIPGGTAALFNKKTSALKTSNFYGQEFLPHMSYSDGSNRFEYVIFSDNARKKEIPQYLNTRKIYGYLTFADDKESFEKESWIAEFQ